MKSLALLQAASKGQTEQFESTAEIAKDKEEDSSQEGKYPESHQDVLVRDTKVGITKLDLKLIN